MNIIKPIWIITFFIILNAGFPTIMRLLGIQQNSYMNIIIWFNLLVILYMIL
jgi:hypothetical protein